jgi:hypothetical protein
MGVQLVSPHVGLQEMPFSLTNHRNDGDINQILLEETTVKVKVTIVSGMTFDDGDDMMMVCVCDRSLFGARLHKQNI